MLLTLLARRSLTALVMGLTLAACLVAQPLASTHGIARESLQRELSELAAALTAREKAILATGPAFRAAYERVAAQAITPEQATKAAAGQLADLPAPLREALEAAKPAVKAHEASLAAYFDTYDRWSTLAMDVKVLEVVGELAKARDDLAGKAGLVKTRRMDAALKAVRADVEDYWANRTVQEGRDSYKRLWALRRLSDSTRTAEQTLTRIRQKIGELPEPRLHEKIAAAAAKAHRTWLNLRTKTGMLPAMTKMLAYLANPLRRKDDPERISGLIREMGTAYVTRAKVDLEIVGRENMPTDARVIVTPSHRSDYVDTMGMTSIMSGQVTPIQTVLFYPKWLRPGITSLMKDEPGLILAQAEGIDVVQRCVDSVKQGRTLLFFPEGNVPSPLGEIRRLRSGLETITEKLLDEKLRIVPVTLDDPADMWGQVKYSTGDAPLGMKMRVIFHKPIDPRAVHAMSHGTERLLLDMLRETYHLALVQGLSAAAAAPASGARFTGETAAPAPETVED